MKAVNKRGQTLNTFMSLGIGLVVVALILAIGVTVLGKFKAASDDANATAVIDALITQIMELPDWVGIIIVVSVAVVIIGLVMLFQRVKGQ